MKTLSLNFVVATFLIGFLAACQSTDIGPSVISQKEQLLVQSGFKAKTVTTPEQQQRVSALLPGKVSIVGYKGKRITYIRLRRRTASLLAIRPSTTLTSRRLWHTD